MKNSASLQQTGGKVVVEKNTWNDLIYFLRRLHIHVAIR